MNYRLTGALPWAPAQSDDLHRPTPPLQELEACLCLKITRCVRKGFTIVPDGKFYQIRHTVRASDFLVELRLNGS